MPTLGDDDGAAWLIKCCVPVRLRAAGTLSDLNNLAGLRPCPLARRAQLYYAGRVLAGPGPPAAGNLNLWEQHLLPVPARGSASNLPGS